MTHDQDYIRELFDADPVERLRLLRAFRTRDRTVEHLERLALAAVNGLDAAIKAALDVMTSEEFTERYERHSAAIAADFELAEMATGVDPLEEQEE